MQQLEAYVGDSAQAFDERGAIKVAQVARLLDAFIEGFAAWIPNRTPAPWPSGQEYSMPG